MLCEWVVLMQLEPQAETMPACIRWTNMLVARRFRVMVGSMVRCSMLMSMPTLLSRTVLTTQKLAGDIRWANRTLEPRLEWLEVGRTPS